jgi:hypothetical protein
VHGGEEPLVEVGRPVVRNLQDVSPKVGARGQQLALRLDLLVARQQHPDAGHGGPQRQ